MKTILVTGGAGFLGSNLCGELLKQGEFVICIDNLCTGREQNIREFYNSNKFQFIEMDVCDTERIKDVLSITKYKIDQIYNLACPASPPHYQKSPVTTLKTCVLGIINMLNLAREHNAKLLQASTSEVYGDPEVHPQPETYRGNVNPVGIRACYDEGKRCAETLCFDYNREYNVKIKVIRIFNTYGPKMDPKDGRVVSNFILQALQNHNLTVYGDGRQTRSFCYVEDLINGMIKLMRTPDDFLGPVNIGNPEEFTMIQLAQKLIEMTASSSIIEYKELPEDDPTQRKPVIDLARKNLNWEPKYTLEEGLKRTIEYYKQYIK